MSKKVHKDRTENHTSTYPKFKKDCKDMCDSVMYEIHKKDICMKSRNYFVIGSTLFGIGLAGALVSAAIFTHVTLYKLKYDAALEYLGFGSLGFEPFIVLFPWIPFTIAAGGLIGGIYMLRRYEIGYRHNLIGVAFGVSALVITSGVLIDQLGAHKHMKRVSILNNLYEISYDRGPFVVGVVDEIQNEGMIVRNPYEDAVHVQMASPALNSIEIDQGNKIKAIGHWEGDTFKVKYVRVQR